MAVTITTSKDINCDKYRVGSWWHSSVYECQDRSTQILSKNDTTITGRSGKAHFYSKTNEDIGSLWMTDTKVFYFPTNLENVFPNLFAISITDCKLMEIHQSDLKPYPMLEKMMLSSNHLAYLEHDLFKFNPKITRLSFADNEIVHVESSVFIELKNLKFLNFKNNLCFSGEADNNRFEVLNLVLSIQLECFDKELYKKLKKDEVQSLH